MSILTKTSTLSMSAGALIIRVMLGSVMFGHGAQKVLGWWGGSGLEATVAGMGQKFPEILVYAAAFSEFLGGLFLIIGLLTRPAAVFVATTMFVASMQHVAGGFFAANKGMEFPLTLAMMAVAVLFFGPGKYSIDAILASRNAAEPANKTIEPAVRSKVDPSRNTARA
ncbi:MAG TPA: DoxX family protein [Candidatus Kapabacteria bacterium]|nr:DoxX family protein [Candidatus Kapabacteria bacterium]